MLRMKRLLGILVAMAVCIPSLSMEALAATKYISSISLKVKAELDTGDSVNKGDEISTEYTESGSYVYTTSSRCRVVSAEWANDKDVSIGDEPKIYVWLELDDNDSDNEYKFRSSYSSSSISVSGGTFVSAKKDGNDLKVTIKTSGVKGTYDAPENAQWGSSRGRATWDPGEDSSDHYDVYLMRGSSTVKKVEDLNSTSYNFYPYMTKEGDYTFKVRSVPYGDSEKKYGKKSEWTESDSLYIDEDEVSDGSGQDNGSGTAGGGTVNVGWQKSDNTWYFKYPDGNYVKGNWFQWNNKWYLFDSSGRMLTGWQQKDGYWYFLNNDGAMQTGWVKSGNLWYYCNPNSGGPQGAMVKSCWLTVNGLTYFINDSGVMVEGWYKVGNDYYYFQPGSGQKLTNTTVDGFRLDANGVWVH